jgi:cell division protein FtsA
MKGTHQVICALDAGTCKTCFLIGRWRGDGRLQMIAGGFSGSSGMKKGVVVDASEAAASIRRAVREAESKSGLSVGRVVAGITGTHLESDNFRGTVEIPGNRGEVTRVDRDNAVRAARSIALDPEREIIHMLPLGFFVNGRGGIADPVGLSGSLLNADLHIITCDGALGQCLINAANRARVAVKRLIAQSLASAEAVLTAEEKELGAVAIDIGGGTTDIAVFLDGSVRFTSVLGAGGMNFTRDLVREIPMSLEEAERVKVEFGTVLSDTVSLGETLSVAGLGMRGPREVSRRAVCVNLRARGEELLELARDDILRSGVRDNLVAGAVITGGGSMLNGMIELAEHILDMPVRQGLPLGFVGLERELAHPACACVVGLALLEAHRPSPKDFILRPPAETSLIDRLLAWFRE